MLKNRKLHVLILFTLFTPCLLFAQWTSGIGDGVDIDVVSPTTAYMVGDLPTTQPNGIGRIYKTTDGGLTVTKIFEKSSAYYRGVFFFNENKGVVVGSESSQGVILKTENGGVTWTRQVLPELYLHGVYFVNDQVGFAYSGFSGVSIYKTTDGGANWREVASLSSFLTGNIQFVNANTGFISSTNGVIKTTDGGETWRNFTVPERINVTSVWFTNESVGHIVLSNLPYINTSYIYRTSDGGLTWEKTYTTPESSFLKGLRFINPLVGYALEDDASDVFKIIKTVDGGNTWQADFTQNGDPNLLVESIEKWDFSGNTAIAIGRNKLIRNSNFTSNLNLNQPTAIISGTKEICPNNAVTLRFDFTGNPPYSFNLKNSQGINTPLSNIASNPYFYTATPSIATTYTLDNFAANGVNGRSGGSATFDNNFKTSAIMFGGEDICLGQNTKNLKLILKGCPPFTVKIGDENGRDSAIIVFQTADTVDVFFKPKLSNPYNVIPYFLLSAKDGYGHEITNKGGGTYVFIYPSIQFTLNTVFPTPFCPDAPIDLNIDGYWVPPYFFTISYDNHLDTLKPNDRFRYITSFRQSTAPLVTLNSFCGTKSIKTDTIKIRPNFPKPQNLKAKNIRGRGVELTWDAYPENIFMDIQKRTPTTDWRFVTQVRAQDNRYFDSLALQGHDGNTWIYRIMAQLDEQYCSSFFSDTVSARVDAFFKKSEIVNYSVPNPNENPIIWANWNQDSLPDILSYDGLSNNLGNNQFSPLYGNLIRQTPLNGISLADIDNDGDLDFIGKDAGEAILYTNRGDNTFDKKSIIEGVGFISALQWIDYNKDGFVDLVHSAVGSNIIIMINNQNGTFTRLNNHPFINREGQIFLADNNNDSHLDAAIYNGNFLTFFKGSGVNQFSATDTLSINGQYSLHGSAGWWDMDGDGDLDLIIPNTTDGGFPSPVQYIKNDNGGWSQTTLFDNQLLYFMSTNIGDYDNDGWLDMIFVDNPGNSPAKFFLNRGFDNGFDLYSNEVIRDGEFISNADIDRDGDLDLTIARSTVVLYENQLAGKFSKGNWLEIKLEGRTSDRLALGTIVRVKAKINGVSRWQIRYLSSSNSSDFGKDDIIIHFGMGDAAVIDSVIIQWISGKKTILTNLPVNRYMHIIEEATINNVCTRPSPVITPLNNLTKLCSQEGNIRLTTAKLAGEQIKWYRTTSGTPQLVSINDTLVLSKDTETGNYTVEIQDILRGCPAVVSANSQQVIISKPNISFTILDSIICGNKPASITPQTQNDTSLYVYYREKYNTATQTWEQKSRINVGNTVYSFNEGGVYHFVATANNNSNCSVSSRNLTIKDASNDILLTGKVTLGTTAIASSNSKVRLYKNRILIDSTTTDATGVYKFKIESAKEYQVKATSITSQYNETFYGNALQISDATTLISTNCESIKADIKLLQKTASQETTALHVSLKAYPNPFSETCIIEAFALKNMDIKISVYDNLGRLALQPQEQHVSIGTQNIQIKDADKLSEGVYVLRISSNISDDIYLKTIKIK